MSQLTFVLLAACVCAAYAGIAPAAIATYAHAAPIAHTYAHAAPIAHAYGHAYGHAIAAPIATYAAAPVAVAAPVLVDPTHFSYGYANPFANGEVHVARNGPVAQHSYTFRAGTAY